MPRLLPALLRLLLLLMLGIGLLSSRAAQAAEAPPAVAQASQTTPAIWISGDHVSTRWQARLMRPRPTKPGAALALGLGLGVAGGLVGGVVGAPLFFVGLPLVTGTLGAALGATTGAWLYSGDAPFWFMGVGAALGVSAASLVQAALLFGSAAAAVTIVGLPLAVALVGVAAGVGLVLMPVGACLAALYHRKNPVPGIRFRPQGLQPVAWTMDPAEPASESSSGAWEAPAWQPAAAAAGWGGEQL